MAVVSFKLKSDGRTASIENAVKRNYTNEYVAVTDSTSDTQLTVRTDPRCPQPGAAFPGDTRAIVRSVNVDSIGKFAWNVTVEYSTFVGDPAQIEQQENPLNDPYVFEFNTIHTTKVAQKAYTQLGAEVGLTNSAFEPFDAADLEILAARPAWRITYNSPSFNATTAEQYTHTVNSAPFYGWPPRTAFIYEISARSARRNLVSYFEVSVDVHFNAETWDLVVLDMGHREFNFAAPTNPWKLFKDAEGNLDPVPRLLNGAGFQLAPNAPAVFRTFRVYKESDFSNLIL